MLQSVHGIALFRRMFPVSAAKTQALAERLDRLGIRDEDLEEHFVRSRGRGGQNVNKVATCVVLLHRPTGTLVKCQRERSQALNRFHARRILADKIERARLGAVSAEAERIARLRRQKRRRSRRAKEKMLADKHARGEIKARRARIVEEGE
jgi:protein subunit release factor B